MTDQRPESDVGPILHAWMSAVAPQRAPERLLEEAFARTMVSGQRRVYPWHVVRTDLAPHGAARGRAGFAFAGVAVVLVVSLSVGLALRLGQNVGGPSPTPSPLPTPSATPRTSPSPFPSPVLVEPMATIPVTGVITMATDGTSIWLFTADGELMRIDPLTNAIAASVSLAPATNAYQSLAGDGDGLWITDWDAATVLRFDPTTLLTTGSIDVGTKPKGVLITSAAVWIGNTRGGSVQRIDPTTNEIVSTISLGPTGPSGPNWLASGFGSIWAGVPNIGSVFRINATTNAIEAEIPVVSPASPCGGLATTSTAVWITSCDGSNYVTQIDPATNTVVGTIDLGGNGYVFAVVADRPWISPTEGQIVRLDPVSHAVDRVIAPGPGFASGGGDVAVADGSMWVMDWAANRVLRLPIDAFGG